MQREQAEARHWSIRRPARTGVARRGTAAELATAHGGVVHRQELAECGIDSDGIRNEVAAGRWFKLGRHTVAIGSPEIGLVAQWWRAVWESGAGARLDGASALCAHGMTGFRAQVIDVSLPARNRHHAVDGVRPHRLRQPPPAAKVGIPRVSVEMGMIHAGQWAVSDRQAALVICLPMQQRMTSTARLSLAWRGIGRSARRPFLDAVIADVTDGAHSLGELDFARMVRRVGLPAPTRQAIRCGADGRVYLDVSWDDVGLVVEIDGGHHALALNPVDDALRQNDRVIAGERVLRIPVIGLRLAPDQFLMQIRRMYDALRITQ
ncbi:hypothetical protein [Flexivirga alba]|uniref:DUF559 domain-containing protein n=1 Tax=Flexivirga alba TaxID=702742 RepID=A0ABW2AJH8_9MICO